MSRDPRYQKLLNSKRWDEVKRIVWQRAGGLCERCKRDGFIRAGVDCHHIKPVEGATTEDEMLARCYDDRNIELLCVECHIKTHQEMRSHKADKVAENKRRGAERRASWLDPNYEANQGAGAKADAYLKNLEEQAKMEDIIYPDDDPNKTPI